MQFDFSRDSSRLQCRAVNWPLGQEIKTKESTHENATDRSGRLNPLVHSNPFRPWLRGMRSTFDVGKQDTMDSNVNDIVCEKEEAGSETPHKQVKKVVETIGYCAVGIFLFGAYSGASWPAAVAVCGLSLMGVGVAYFMLRRT
jgi:hypothetical protein